MEAVKHMREKRNLSQSELAAAIGKTQSYVSRIETGARTNPSFDTLWSMAMVLKCSIQDLIDDPRDTVAS